MDEDATLGHGPDMVQVHPPTTLPDKIFLKHWVHLKMKSSGNSKKYWSALSFGSNVGPHPQNAKFSNVLLRRCISEVRVNLVICNSLGLLYIFVVLGVTVCKTVCPMISDRCLSACLSVCLSVMFVHCGQTVGRIKMKLGIQVGLGPGLIVLDGDPPPPAPKGHSPPVFGPYLLCQMAAWIKMSLGMESTVSPTQD